MSVSDAIGPAHDAASTSAEDFNVLESSAELSIYKKMYNIMFNAATDAMENMRDAGYILRKAQQNCEEIFLNAADTEGSAPMDQKTP